MFAEGFTRYSAPRHAPKGFATHVEAMSPPSNTFHFRPRRGQCKEIGDSRPVLRPRGVWVSGLVHCFHHPSAVAIPVAILLGVALVVLLLALGEADLQFRAAGFPVEFQGDERIATSFD
jgi:hypothetical protein